MCWTISKTDFGLKNNVKDIDDLDDIPATLKILYDGNEDLQRRIRSPDNLVWTANNRVCVQEDEAEEDSLTGEPLFGDGAVNENEAGIVCLDGDAETEKDLNLERIANIDRTVVLDASIAMPSNSIDKDAGSAGEWESSGIIDLSMLFGSTPTLTLPHQCPSPWY